MMHLYLIRHGIAVDREDPNCPPDTERPLTPKGMKRSHAAALGLRALDVKPNAVLTSPWLRAVQTAEIFCEMIGYPSKKIMRTDALKGTSAPVGFVSRTAIDESQSRALLRPRTASAPRNRPRPPHQRENHGTQKSGPRAFGIGAQSRRLKDACSPSTPQARCAFSQNNCGVSVAQASACGVLLLQASSRAAD